MIKKKEEKERYKKREALQRFLAVVNGEERVLGFISWALCKEYYSAKHKRIDDKLKKCECESYTFFLVSSKLSTETGASSLGNSLCFHRIFFVF